MRNAKVDLNQKAVVEALRAIGASVQSLAPVGQGVPDLLVGWRNRNYLIEVKTLKGKLTEPQVKWHGDWKGTVHVVRTAKEAIEVLQQGV